MVTRQSPSDFKQLTAKHHKQEHDRVQLVEDLVKETAFRVLDVAAVVLALSTSLVALFKIRQDPRRENNTQGEHEDDRN